MKHFDNVAHPIQWAEGMLLAPQHLQQDQIQREQLMGYHLRIAEPYYWGLGVLDIDIAKLAEGILELRKCEAVLPDGIIMQYDLDKAPEDEPLSIDLNEASKDIGDDVEFKIYLQVPKRGPAAASYSSSMIRYQGFESEPVKDENTGDGLVTVFRLKPQFSLSVKLPSSQYSAVAICAIKRDLDGLFKITDYVPPLLAIRQGNQLKPSSSDVIYERIRSCLSTIRVKVAQLAALTGEQRVGRNLNEYHQLMIAHLTSVLPELEISLSAQSVTPFEMYKGLARMIAQISQLHESGMPPTLPTYNHDDSYPCFKKVLEFTGNIISNINLRFSLLSFEQVQPGVFSLMLDNAWLQQSKHLTIELRSDENTSTGSLYEWLDECCIASSGVLARVLKQRSGGLVSKHISQDDELGIKAGQGRILAQLPIDPRFIIPGQKLIIKETHANQAAKRPAHIILYVTHQVDDA